MAKFVTIASGSSGNCTFFGDKHTKILIDAGVSGKKIKCALNDIGISGNDIDAVLITHEHIDHVQGLGILSRKFDIPVYATEGTWNCMPSSVGEIQEHNKIVISKNQSFVINDLLVKPYSIPHDAVEPVGYSVFSDNFKLSVATDIGHITEEIMENIKDCNLLLIESNHDVDMLENSTYPLYLKRRIFGKNGHLSNDTAGKLIAWAICRNSNLKNVFLGHLSQENNTPKIALHTVKNILDSYNIKVGNHLNLYVAPKYGVEKIIKI